MAPPADLAIRARWDAWFAGDDYLFGTAPNAYLRAQAPLLRRGMTALAVADGEGRNGVWLASQGLAVTSIDLSAVGVEKARRLARERDVALTAHCADVLTWDWPVDAVDVVAEIFLQIPSAERRTVHSRIRRALKPGGIVILEAFHKRGLGRTGPRDADLLYDAAGLADDFAGLDILELLEGTVRLDEGERHQGLAEVVRLVARRLDQ
ncbi:MAG TPA: class I SAM-dependent methyltransferase [Stellaceae bacterium]|nr:class I SAM-dependent methyltransferase [Stellaceae bacterium]